MPQSIVGYAVDPSWQRPVEKHHVPIPLPLDDCLRCVGISPSYVGDMPYIGFQEQPHRPVALALWVGFYPSFFPFGRVNAFALLSLNQNVVLCPSKTFCLYWHRYHFSKKTARELQLFFQTRVTLCLLSNQIAVISLISSCSRSPASRISESAIVTWIEHQKVGGCKWNTLIPQRLIWNVF